MHSPGKTTNTSPSRQLSGWLYGGCHCQAILFRCRRQADNTLIRCHCSLCTPVAYLHWLVPHEDFQLLRGRANLVEYRFNTHSAAHWFCATCGVKSFYQPRSHPECYSINARCLTENLWRQWPIQDFNGAQWEAHIQELK